MGKNSLVQIGKGNPCEGCSAICCSVQIFPIKTPRNFMDVDYMRFMLQFPNTEYILAPNGDFSVVKWERCSFLDEKNKCKLHGTPEKPKTCTQYNPWNCWYHSVFTANNSPDLIRLNLERYNLWSQYVQFDSNYLVTSMPTFAEAFNLVGSVPIQPVFPNRGQTVAAAGIPMAPALPN
jgi:hypothetical protein